jgi:hypothetical protein
VPVLSEKMKWIIPSYSFRLEELHLAFSPFSGQTILQSIVMNEPWKNLTISRHTSREIGTKFIMAKNQVPKEMAIL